MAPRRRAHVCGAAHIRAALGMTMRDQQRAYFYAQLDERFPKRRAPCGGPLAALRAA